MEKWREKWVDMISEMEGSYFGGISKAVTKIGSPSREAYNHFIKVILAISPTSIRN
jgi:hypothetical protein